MRGARRNPSNPWESFSHGPRIHPVIVITPADQGYAKGNDVMIASYLSSQSTFQFMIVRCRTAGTMIWPWHCRAAQASLPSPEFLFVLVGMGIALVASQMAPQGGRTTERYKAACAPGASRNEAFP